MHELEFQIKIKISGFYGAL